MRKILEIWEALMERIYQWIVSPVEELGADTCQCDHRRCAHTDGRYRCHVGYPTPGFPENAMCPCAFFIRKDDEDGDDQPAPEPSVEELERLYHK